jgi:hypothetical protein
VFRETLHMIFFIYRITFGKWAILEISRDEGHLFLECLGLKALCEIKNWQCSFSVLFS